MLNRHAGSQTITNLDFLSGRELLEEVARKAVAYDRLTKDLALVLHTRYRYFRRFGVKARKFYVDCEDVSKALHTAEELARWSG